MSIILKKDSKNNKKHKRQNDLRVDKTCHLKCTNGSNSCAVYLEEQVKFLQALSEHWLSEFFAAKFITFNHRLINLEAANI